MKVAVIGGGYWGKNHVRDYVNLGLDVTVCDLSEDLLQQLKEKHPNIQITTDLNEVLNDSEIKAVSIVVPNHLHYSFAKKFLNAGKNILLEKPMALHSSECRELVNLAKEKKVLLAVGHIFRFNAALRKVKEMIQAGGLGEIYLAKLAWTNLEPIFEDREVLFDLAVHPFDIIHFLFDQNPDWISCIGEGYRKKEGGEVAFINAKIGKTVMNLEISWLTPRKVRELILVGSKKTAFVDCLKQTLKVYDNESKEEQEIELTPINALVAELTHFIDCVKNGTKSVSDGEIGYWIISVLEQAQKSMRQGKIISLQ